VKRRLVELNLRGGNAWLEGWLNVKDAPAESVDPNRRGECERDYSPRSIPDVELFPGNELNEFIAEVYADRNRASEAARCAANANTESIADRAATSVADTLDYRSGWDRVLAARWLIRFERGERG
jgi:hypothetical protein